jgi:CUB domain
VRLNFNYIKTEECCDFVCIYDGNNSDASMMDKLSGDYLPPWPSYTTTQRYLFVEFESDYAVQFAGFDATYQSTLTG